MATYKYEILGEDGTIKGIFETEQKMSEPALTRHPETGETVRRILSRTFAHGSSRSSGSGDYGGDSCSTGTCGVPYSGGGCSTGSCGWN
jgi:predicted nucleic acid-binding Zn ribbon protein